MFQLEQAMGDIKEQKYVLIAKANIKKTWEDVLSEAKIQDRDAKLVATWAKKSNGRLDLTKPLGLKNPNDPVTTVCVYIY